MQTPPLTPGYLRTPHGNVWYGIAGNDRPGTPLLLLHGGPSFPSYYLEPLTVLADVRPVIVYDQLGCGRSDRITDPGLCTVAYFRNEIDALRRELKLEHIFLFGHSWGGQLAADYLMEGATGVEKLVLAGPSISVPRWAKDMQLLLDMLPGNAGRILRSASERGDSESPEYLEALDVFLHHYEFRTPTEPECMQRSSDELGTFIYETMWGPDEYTPRGTLATYDRSKDLGSINVPTLFTCGTYDGCSPAAARWYASFMPHAEVAVFKDCSHQAHLDKPEAYTARLRQFFGE